jgi:hypothetical protein
MSSCSTANTTCLSDIQAEFVPGIHILKLPISFLLGLALSAAMAVAQTSSGPIVFTIAGGTLGDGKLATSTGIGESQGDWTVDQTGNLYIADYDNYLVHKVNAVTGILSTVVGTGRSPGWQGFIEGSTSCPDVGDGGQATSAELCNPLYVTADRNGDLYILEQTQVFSSPNFRVRKVDASGVITTLSSSTVGGPFVVDSLGDIYFFPGCYVEKLNTSGVVTTVAGNGTCGFSGDGGPATSAEIMPSGIALDSSGDVLIKDGSCRVRMVTTNGLINTVAGNGTCGFSGDGGPATSASISPYDFAVDGGGNIYLLEETFGVSQPSACRVRQVNTGGVINTVAGNGTCGSSGDGGTATSAEIFGFRIVADGVGNYYIEQDDLSGVYPGLRIRKVNSSGTITTVAGNGSVGFSGDGGSATSAEIDAPAGLAVDSNGNLYIADYNNFRVRKVNSTGTISTFAGDGQNVGPSGDGGPATSAAIFIPIALGLDNSGNLLLVENEYNEYSGTASQGVVRKVDTSGDISTVSPAICGSLPYTACPLGLAIDANGNVYFSSVNDYRVYKFALGGLATVVAGNGTKGSSGDGGAATSAQLSNPEGLTLDTAGNLYIGDGTLVRKVDLAGIITTFAGNGTLGDSGDGGPATGAQLSTVSGLAIDSGGNLYIADGFANRIRKVDTKGVISSYAGDGKFGYVGDGGPATSAEFNNPGALAIDSHGDLFVGDVFNYRVREIALPFTVAASPSSISISRAGQTGNTSLNFTAAAFFTGNATLACSVAFTGSGSATDPPTCLLGSSTVSLTGPNTANVTLTVNTTAPQTRADLSGSNQNMFAFRTTIALGVLGLLILPGSRRRRASVITFCLFLVTVGYSLSGCGGGNGNTNPSNPGTTPGTYNVTVTATSGTFSTSVVVSTVV